MAKKRVVIADDSQLARILMKRALAQGDLEVVGEARNGREALDLFRELRPDLVVSDIVMPEMDGVQLLRAILAEDSAAKVVLLSSLGQSLNAEEGLQAGAHAVVAKPFTPEDLLAAIDMTGSDTGAS